MRLDSITGNNGTRVKPEKYEVMKRALLEILPTSGAGLTIDEMIAALRPRVPAEMFPKGPGWYMMSVKLNLEAQGVVRRVPGSKPLRHLRVEGAA